MIKYRSLKDLSIDTVIMLILIISAILSLMPLVNTLAISFSAQSKANAGIVYFWPLDFSLSSYAKLVKDLAFWRAFKVSVERVFVGGFLNVALCIFMAYPLSKETKTFKSRNIYMWIIVFSMLFNGGLIPWYMTIRAVGLIDNFWALILPGAVNAFNVILLMNFFRSLPKELEEAAVIDGAGPWTIMLRIFVPVSLPGIATITLFSIVTHWNSFFDGLILMSSPSKFPLQTYIQQLTIVIDVQNITDPNLLKQLMTISNKTINACKIFVSVVPMLVLYPFLQKYFISGIVLGSVKE